MGLNLFDAAGMGDLFSPEEEEKDYFEEGGTAGKNFFDATNLPDSSTRQMNAEGSQTYVLHLAFPSAEELQRAIYALTDGERKSMKAGQTEAVINAVAVKKKEEITWLEFWEHRMLGKLKLKVKKIDEDPDEAKAPV